jgi:type VI secretion system protein ImpL
MIYLKHVEGSKRGQVESFDLERIRIGRHPDNDLKFDPDADREISGHHAEILCQGERVSIRDLQSRNGTLVNGHRINQATLLRHGDTIQFAPTGPKVVFSLGEAAHGTGTIAIDRDQIAAARASATEPAAAAAPATAAAPSPRKVLIFPAAALLLLVIVALVLAAWWSWTSFFVLLGVLILTGVTAGLWWWLRQRSAAKSATAPPTASRRGAPRPEPPRLSGDGDENTVRELRAKWAQALERLRGSKLGRQDDDAIAALPWLVALGERGSGKSELIRAGNPPASVSTVRQAVSGTRTCDWWFFDGAVILDTPGRYVFPVDARADGREWEEFLALLAKARPAEPLNGVLITVAADSLAARSEASLKDEATQIRRRLDELARRVGVTPPIYLVVTKIDLLAGFKEFFADMPEPNRNQAMGWVCEDVGRAQSPAGVLRRALRATTQQLDRLRLAVIDGRHEVGHRLGRPFLFPDEFRALTSPLRTFCEALLRANQYDETPWFRGIFFTSATAEGAPASYLARVLGLDDVPATTLASPGPFFVRDLFGAILPKDRELVRRSGAAGLQAGSRRRAVLVAVGASAFVLCVFLTVSFMRNSRALAWLDLSPCQGPSSSGVAVSLVASLQRLDECRAMIDELMPRSFWNRVTTDFWLRQTARLEGPLARRYVEVFKVEVDQPLEAALDRTLVPGPRAPVIVAAVLQRITLIGKCRADRRCPAQDPGAWPNYRVLLGAADPRIQEGDAAAISLLRRTHAAYLGWLADPRVLDEIRARDVVRVAHWLSAGGLRTEWILASASSQFTPVRSRDFWGWDGPLQVDAPFTRRASAEAIQPLVDGLRTIAPDAQDVRGALGRFESDYRSEALRQWGQFLASFPQEERVLGGRRGSRDLAVRALDANSPYRRVLEAAAADVGAIAGPVQAGGEVPAWANTLLRYAALKNIARDSRSLAKQKPEESKGKYTDAERQALGYLAAYGEALDQLRGELGGSERAYQSVQKVFEEGEPTERGGHPVHRALWNLQALRGMIGARQGDDRIVWGLLSRPVELVWRVMLAEAAQRVQGLWEAMIPGLAGLTPGLQAAKIIEFANGPAAVLLERSRDRYVLRRFLGESAPLSPAFVEFISRIRWIPQDRLDRIDPPRSIVTS